MKWTATIGLWVWAMVLLTGCAARSLSVLQAEFNAAVENRAACNAQVAYEPTAAANCSVDYQTIFADIAAQAERSLTQYDGTAAIQIGLYRLHAYALWQSGAAEKTIAQTAREGLAACAGDNYAKAPRDCALLATIGSLKSVEAIGTTISGLHAALISDANRAAACTANAGTWRDIAADYWHNDYLPLTKDMQTWANRDETPASVLQYLQSQHQAAYDQLKRLENMGRMCVPDDTVARALIACPCNPRLRTGEDQEACRKVFDSANPAHAFYFDTFCMLQSINVSDACPCGDGDRQHLSEAEKRACDGIKTDPDARMLYETRCRLEKVLE